MKDFIYQYKYTIICAVAALILVILFFTLGFLKTIIALVLIGIGGIIGFSKDKDIDVKNYFDDFWNNKG